MYPKAFYADAKFRQRNGTCFVIMPFAPEFDIVYRTIKSVMRDEVGFECSRADDLHRGGHIIEDMLRGIAEAEFIVADLTGRNPNVFYELGIAQMVKDVDKITMLSRTGEAIPFDIGALRHISYDISSPGGEVDLRSKLVAGVRTAGAGEGFRFTLMRGQRYQFPHKLMAADGYMYDFCIPDAYFGVGGGKLQLQVTRHAIRKPDVVVYNSGIGLSVGQPFKINGLDWDLLLESVANDVASFVVQRAQAEKPMVAERVTTSTPSSRRSFWPWARN
jgi:hypothetical protein